MWDNYSRVAAAAASVLLLGAVAEPARSHTTLSDQPVSHQLLASGAASESAYQTLYVNPDIGSDQAEGIVDQPVQTVTHALAIAAPNTVIVLAPGKYTQASGEVFPLQLKSGVTIQGTPGERSRSAIIEGGGNFNSPSRSQQNAAVVAADRAGIAQVAISNPDGYGLWIESASPTILESAFVGNRQTGIYVTGGSPRVQGSYFSGNRVAGLVVFGASNASIESNTFEGTGDAIRVVEGATPEIIGNRMTNNNAGLVLIGNARPVLRDNLMEGNRRNDIVEIAASSTQSELASLSTLVESAASSEQNASNAIAMTENVPGEPAAVGTLPPLSTETRSATNLTLSSENADIVPGDRLGLTTEARPTVVEAPPPAIRSRLVEQAEAEAALAQRQTESAPVEVTNETVSEPAVELVEATKPFESPESNSPPELEADAIAQTIPAGAPGSALAALQSGLAGRSLSPLVALGPRAVTGENPDSPVLPARNERDRPIREESEAPEEAEPEISRPFNNNRLAVPSSAIPIGSGGSSTVFSPPSGGGMGSPPAPPSRAQSLGLYYRVFVEASDPFVQDDVKEVVSDAFRTQFDGRTMMQVGAFPTEEEAEERQQLLEQNNFDAQVEYIR
ncbi:MAG: hypothetical protein DCF25_03180 [Leptolyngbya foveolarum]|uniref:DUF1565 domain-containing protein n=1 Tax=Leptolyngbya foveolarum TaxID=47253 RepID=A0A2W4WIY9_9CYAN|nr:MAG: hypothetical protein DCF25_03180 [Leptolyngbya foveolarum]